MNSYELNLVDPQWKHSIDLTKCKSNDSVVASQSFVRKFDLFAIFMRSSSDRKVSTACFHAMKIVKLL